MTEERGAGPAETKGIGLTRNHGIAAIAGLSAVAIGWVFLHAEPPKKPSDREEALRVQPVARFEPAPNPAPATPVVFRPPQPFSPVVAPPPAPAASTTKVEDPMKAARHASLLVSGGNTSTPPAREPAKTAGETTREATTDLGQRLTPTKVTAVTATILRNQPYLLTRGAHVACILETAIDTTLPGPISCRLPQDVLGKTGLKLLDRGTVITGETGGNMRQGQERVFALWSRAETPQGVVIDMNSPGADPLGRAGFPGAVETHAGARILNAVLVSLVSSGMQTASSSLQTGGAQLNTGGTSSAMDDALRGSVNIQPTLRMNQGDTVSISVIRDMDFSTVYSLAVR